MIFFKNDAALVIKEVYEEQIKYNSLKKVGIEDSLLNENISILLASIKNCEKIKVNILEEDLNDLYLSKKHGRICIENSEQERIVFLEMPSPFDKKEFDGISNVNIDLLFIEHGSIHSAEVRNIENRLLKNKLTKNLINSKKIEKIKDFLMICCLTDIHTSISIFPRYCINPNDMNFECYLNPINPCEIEEIDNIERFFFNMNENKLKGKHNIESYQDYIKFLEEEKFMHDYINSYGEITQIRYIKGKQVLMHHEDILFLVNIKDNTKLGIDNSSLSMFGNLDNGKTDYVFKDYINNKNEIYQYFKLLDY